MEGGLHWGCRMHARTERVACVLRMAVGVLVVVMTISFDPLVHWLAVTAAVTSIGWSLLMALALHSRLDREELAALATGSHWYDILLALAVFAIFLPDPVATPVAALPLLVFRLATRYGLPGAWSGGALFVGLIVLRIVVNRMLHGEGLVRPPLLLAWALVATLVVVLALEMRAQAPGEETIDSEEDAESSDDPDGLSALPVGSPGEASPALDRLDDLAGRLWSQLAPVDDALKLTQRELEILLLLGQGRSYKSAASSLFISVGTVRNHVHNIRHKLGLSDREQLDALAREVAARSLAERDASAAEPDRPARR